MKKVLLTWLLCLLCISAFSQRIDTQKSAVQFKVSNMGAKFVSGSITGITGTVSFHPQQLSEAHIAATIDVATINTGNEQRDTHLRHQDFFFATQYPTATFTSSKIEATENGYVATGILQLRGVSKEVAIPFQVTTSGEESVLTGQLTLKRKDFAIGQKYGRFLVGRKVRLQIVCAVI